MPNVLQRRGRSRHSSRQGFLLLWANLAVLILFLLAGAVLALAGAAARGIAASESAADRVLLAQEVMETMKYNTRFHEAVPIPQAAERDGRRYRVHAGIEPYEEGGIPLRRLFCEVTGEDGTVTRLAALASVERP